MLRSRIGQSDFHSRSFRSDTVSHFEAEVLDVELVEETPDKLLDEEPDDAPAEEPVEVLDEEPDDAPAEEPVEVLDEEPADAPADAPVALLDVEESVDVPVAVVCCW